MSLVALLALTLGLFWTPNLAIPICVVLVVGKVVLRRIHCVTAVPTL